MMNKSLGYRILWPVLGIVTVLVVALSLTRPTSGQPDEFIIQNADATRTIDVMGDSQLTALLGQVADRIVFQYANANRLIQIVPAPAELKTLLGQTADRIVFQYANANRLIQIIPAPAELKTIIGQTADRIIFQYANANRLVPVSYPAGLINDITLPTISDLAATPFGAGLVKVTWNSNELTKSVVNYGFNAGSYTQQVEDDYFRISHEALLSGIGAGVTVYYQIISTDRSGNTHQSQEYQTIGANNIFLPHVSK
jgi:hypothetical protein